MLKILPACVSLSSYTLRVKEKSTNKYIILDQLNEEDDTLEIFTSFFDHFLANVAGEDESKKLFRIHRYQPARSIEIESTEYRLISGIVKTGSYGYESDIVNKNGNIITHHRTSEEAELLPFYFLVAIPRNKDEGIVILQSFKQYGIKKIFTENFENYFKSERAEYKIEINDLIPEKLLTELLERGSVTKLRYISFKQPVDLADAVDTEDHEEDPNLKAELILSEKKGIISGVVNSIKGRLPYKKGQNDDPLKKLIEITSFEYDTVKIEVRVNGKYRNIDLCDLGNIRPTMNITGDVVFLNSGHPEFDSINQIAIDLFKELASGLGIESGISA